MNTKQMYDALVDIVRQIDAYENTYSVPCPIDGEQVQEAIRVCDTLRTESKEELDT